MQLLSNKVDRYAPAPTWAARRAFCLFLLSLPHSQGPISAHTLIDLAAVQAQMGTHKCFPPSCQWSDTLLRQPDKALTTSCIHTCSLTLNTLPSVSLLEHSLLVKGKTHHTLRNYERSVHTQHIYTHAHWQTETHSLWGRAKLATFHVMHYFDVHWTVFKEKYREIINWHVGSGWYSPPHSYRQIVSQLPRGFCCHGDNQIVAFTAYHSANIH